jgi:hypothetical protein
MYGKSISIDLHNCNVDLFNRRDLRKFVKALCVEINMIPAKLVWWDYGTDDEGKAKAPPHLKGVSMVQFIDLFSCGDFDAEQVVWFVEDYFEGNSVNSETMDRK